jgi:hypothetical protein
MYAGFFEKWLKIIRMAIYFSHTFSSNHQALAWLGRATAGNRAALS